MSAEMQAWDEMPVDQVIHGDCLTVMRDLPDCSVDAIVTDPPAGISFMGKEWDKDKGGRDAWMAWMAQIMREALRVIKPGGHALVWSLPRTSHWTGMALEDAGWQVRDCIYSIFGSGFPKSLDVGKAIDKHLQAERQTVGYGLHAARRHSQPFGQGATQDACIDTRAITAPATPEAAQWQGFGSALKPAVECWWLCRKPLSEKTIAQNVLTWGCGALNIDQCRVTLDGIEHHRTAGSGAIGTANGIYSSSKDPINRIQQEREQQGLNPRYDPSGRFPSNLVMSHDPRCIARGTKRVRGNKGFQGYEGPHIPHVLSDGGLKQRSTTNPADEHGFEEVPAFECHPSCPVRVLGEQSGERKSGGRTTHVGDVTKHGHIYHPHTSASEYAMERSEGDASRYFQQFHDPLSSLEAPAFECVEGCPVRVLGEQSGERVSKWGKSKAVRTTDTIFGMHATDDEKETDKSNRFIGDTGTAARYFTQFHDPLETLDAPFHYFSKASRAERNRGLPLKVEGALLPEYGEGLSRQFTATMNGGIGKREHIPEEPNAWNANHHPTVKPVSLMRWLCRLITPPGGIVLDPFCGSGSTLVSCVYEGFSFLGIEQELEYVNIARARIAHVQQEARREESEGQEWECVEECPIKVLEKQSKGTRAERSSGGHQRHNTGNGHGFIANGNECESSGYDDSKGGASRYFQQFPPEPVSLWDEEVAE